MQQPDPPLNPSACPICRKPLAPDSAFCSECGTRPVAAQVEELRAVLYLLSELERWQAEGKINRQDAAALASAYELRRDRLRARLASSTEEARHVLSTPAKESAARTTEQTFQTAEPTFPHADETQTVNAASAEDQNAAAPEGRAANAGASPSILFPLARPAALHTSPQPDPSRPRRAIAETLSEPYTLRLLLYTGAAMFVVGVVIWLRDVLYLKLQEPVVQAGLLMLGTIILTASGWYTILRTRQRFTGRALTLTGSLLVPVNFWFLVRSGLIADRGRAWVVWAFCTLLYAHTAALLGEKLYVYLACAASVATGWALVYRAEASAPGLYALVLIAASLVFLHLSRMFPASSTSEGEAHGHESEAETGAGKKAGAKGLANWSRELWSGPLVHAAHVSAALCALLYMPLRLGPSPSLYDGLFRLRAREYDSGTAILLFTGVAYVAWFTGRYVDAKRRVSLNVLCALALFWTEFLILDGLRLSGTVQILLLAVPALVVSLMARRAQGREQSRPFYLASVFVSVILCALAFALLSSTEAFTLTQSAGFALLAVVFTVLSAPRLSEPVAQKIFAYVAATLASTAFLVALASLQLRSTTVLTAACAVWPFVLYGFAEFARRERRETQMAAPLIRTASVEFVLLLLWASMMTLILYLSKDGIIITVPRAAVFCALSAPLVYGLLRAWRERSRFGAELFAMAAVMLVASVLDALEDIHLWPKGWPIAAGVICAAFALERGGAKWLRLKSDQSKDGARSLDAHVRLVTDMAVILCALLWLIKAVILFERGGWSAVCVMLLALAYWAERVAEQRTARSFYLAAAHACAFFLAVLIALGTDPQWFAALFVLIPAPIFFGLHVYARSRQVAWVAAPASAAATLTMGLAFVAAVLQMLPHLQTGDPLLLAPALTFAALALLSFIVSLLAPAGKARVHAFRAGLYLSVITYALACLRSGFAPLADVEVYTSPVAILLLAAAYISFRRAWNDYERDTSLLFWAGSLLLTGPLLLRALQFRLLLDMPAPSRDLVTLCASLALLLFGVVGRVRAPVIIGGATLLIELAALALTSVDWLQVPLKIYLVTVGALLALIGWMFEYRREQLLLLRSRLNARREMARERFGEWR